MFCADEGKPICVWRRCLSGWRVCCGKARYVSIGVLAGCIALVQAWGGVVVGRTSSAAGSLTYERRGTGPGILFVHGFGGNRAVWRDIAVRLERDHTTVCIDLPGSGGSPPPPERSGSADFETIARQLTATVGELGLEPCMIVGHSMGGSLAALAVLNKPAAYRALVIVDQDLCPGQPLSSSLWALVQSNPQAFLAGFLAPGARTGAEADRAVAEAMTLESSVRASYLSYLGKDDLRGRRQALNLPVALFTPAALPPTSVSTREWLARHGFGGIPSVQVERFPGTGHWIMWDDPESFSARLRTLDGPS